MPNLLGMRKNEKTLSNLNFLNNSYANFFYSEDFLEVFDMPRITVFDVPAQYLIEEIARDLKENQKLKQPEFAMFVKTGAHRQRPPQQKDWWYVRCASILRRLYVDGPHGVERLRTYYGGRKDRGTEPEKFVKASGKVIRSCLQALEGLGFLEKHPKGRKVSPKGESYLTKISKLVHSKLEKGEYQKEAEQKKLERMKRLQEMQKEKEKLKETVLAAKGTQRKKKGKKKEKPKEKKKKEKKKK